MAGLARASAHRDKRRMRERDARRARRRTWRRRLRRLVAWWILGSLLPVVYLRYAPPLFTAFQVAEGMASILSGEAPQIDYRWVAYEAIAPTLAAAVIAAEDQRFFAHHGFDIEEIYKAWRASRHGRRLRGASTISQQTAKNLFLWSGRGWMRKGLEAYFTLALEAVLSKRRILELYLNVVELGPGVYGAEAAAQRFFAKPAAKLTASEAALLAAVLPNPRRLRVDRPSPYVRARAARILSQMTHLGNGAALERGE